MCSGVSRKWFMDNVKRVSESDWHALRIKQLTSVIQIHPQLFITMLSWSVTFLIIALIAAALGFGGIAGTAVGIAKILFFVFIVLFILSLIFGRKRV